MPKNTHNIEKFIRAGANPTGTSPVVSACQPCPDFNFRDFMNFQFNRDHAIKYGVEESILIYHLAYWVNFNHAEKKNFINGHTWTFNSIRGLQELFPFWTKRQIERIIISLVNQKVIITGRFNKKGYDRTTWYAFLDESFIFGQYRRNPAISPNGEMDFTKRGNGFHQTVEPIPDNTTQDKTTKINTETAAVPETEPAFPYKSLHDLYSACLKKHGLYDPSDYGKKAAMITKKMRELLALSPENRISPETLSVVLQNAEADKWMRETGLKFNIIASSWMILLNKNKTQSPPGPEDAIPGRQSSRAEFLEIQQRNKREGRGVIK